VTIREAAAAIRAKRVSPVELTRAALDRAARFEGQLRAFITFTQDYALDRARLAESELAAGKDRGPLHGIPVAVKDLFAMRGVRTTAGSKIFENHVTDFDSAAVERLQAAGAVILGKLNMHEIAYGITSANPHFGVVRNPWDTGRSPGGSSGGSAAAVAANVVYAAMGSDTGGSIRIPASFCGTVGLKPTYGRVSRYGAFPLSWSLDHMGPITRGVRDAALMLNAIAGRDPRDETSSRRPLVDFVPDDDCSIRGMRIGFPRNFYFDRVDASVESAVRGAIARAASLGAVLKPVEVPDIEGLNAVGQVTQLAEATAFWEPHLGQREKFGADVLTRLDQGRLVPATDYVNAQRLRRTFRQAFERLWTEVDCFVAPTTPAAAPRIGENTIRLAGRDEDTRVAATRLVRGINVVGLPAISMPCGLSAEGLPVGLQIVGQAFEEAAI
jgi:aspartyl-tRNA(Asn)/glutamyl-tRNA(Gln) amidotransferase subunit A